MTTTSLDDLRAASRKLSALDYSGTIRSFYPFWDAQYRPYLLAAVAALPKEHFDFKPHPSMLETAMAEAGKRLGAQQALVIGQAFADVR